MPIDWIFGLIGGLLIGLAGAVYLLGNGRIMGASGIIGGLVDGTARGAWAERGAFLAALVAVPAVLQFGIPVVTGAASAPVLLITAGLCVGIGTRIANGCTSGHGVCGISRFSLRGIVATLIYIGAGVVTVVVLRLMMGGM
ncbi:MAG: YeeE/YedE family protein [Ascidiaceihabitans sp.]|nr:YeeE/YedE family protein [Ascidiaceihabitans sp.]